jgi:hypothetical protein
MDEPSRVGSNGGLPGGNPYVWPPLRNRRSVSYLGTIAAHLSNGSPQRLLGLVVALAAIVTATLTLDATVVLVTPLVLATTARLALTACGLDWSARRIAAPSAAARHGAISLPGLAFLAANSGESRQQPAGHLGIDSAAARG